MHRRSITRFLRQASILPFAALAIGGCGDSESTSLPDSADPPLGVITLANATGLPACDASNKGVVYYLGTAEIFMYCNGKRYWELDLQGLDGMSWAVQAIEADAGECPGGGVTLLAGPDEDKNGVIDGAPTSTATVCNGEDGEDGQDGEDGAPCTVEDNGDGSKTISCPGGDSVVVYDGAGEPLLRLTTEPPGANCPCSGNLIEMGADQDSDNVLDDGEITSSTYSCNACPGPMLLVPGSVSSCALLNDNKLKCWGLNSNGALGLGDTAWRGDNANEMGSNLPVVNLGTGRFAVSIGVAGGHACAVLNDTSLKCWGAASSGQLGLGTTAIRGDGPGEMGDALPPVDLGSGRTAILVTGGAYHTCAVLDDHSVKCWGNNSDGESGIGDTENRGDEAGEMGDALPAVDLGSGRTALSVSCGEYFNCALLDDHSVKCWGYGSDGQSGAGTWDSYGDEPGEMGDVLPTIDLGTGRTALSMTASGYHACALLDDHSVKCWGYNSNGQLGLGDTNSRGDEPGEMGDALPTVDLGSGRTALAVEAGIMHTCALLDDNSVKCWGSNPFGELGLGDTNSRGDEPGEMGDALPAVNLGSSRTVLAVLPGAEHTCVLFDDQTFKCWGYNFHGEVGVGDNVNHGDNSGEMGASLPFVVLQ